MPLLKRTVLLRLKDCLGRVEEMNKVFFLHVFIFLVIIINSFMRVANDRSKQKCSHMSMLLIQVTYEVIPLRII